MCGKMSDNIFFFSYEWILIMCYDYVNPSDLTIATDGKNLSFPDWDIHCNLRYPEHKKMLFYQQIKITVSLRSEGDAVSLGP